MTAGRGRVARAWLAGAVLGVTAGGAAAAGALVGACAGGPAVVGEAGQEGPEDVACPVEMVKRVDDVAIGCLAPGVWRFEVLAPAGHAYPGYPANGLVVVDDDGAGAGAIMIDTAWTPAQAERLLAWAEARGTPERGAVVTHWHDDRTGGAAALVGRGLPVRALAATRARVPELGLTELAPELGAGLAWVFPGPGHSADNIVVLHRPSGIPSDGGAQRPRARPLERRAPPARGRRILFGGCFVKEAAATGLGYVGDADVGRWEASLAAARAAFPEARQVVPGHGAAGGVALLEHTAALVRAAR